jgi:Tol biopolymer transport system component/DNA-binding winged helix-turn-helix (wHTH) protein
MKVPLQEQPFRVLAMLLERPGEIITREELQASLWPADTFVGFDEGINTAIRKLRVVFGDSADNPRFIETIPRRGYRFIAPAAPSASPAAQLPTMAPTVSSASGADASPTAQTQPVHSSGSSVLEAVKQHKLGLTAGLVVALVVLAAAGYGAYSVFTGGRAAVRFQNYTISQITDNAKTQAAIISPDGKYVLSEIVDTGMSSLWLHHIPTNSDTQVVAPSEAFYTNFDFSPDGNYFYFRKARTSTLDEFDLYRAPVLGGNPQIVVRDTDSNTGFSPDGKHIAYERGNDPEVGKCQLLIANADGTGEKMIASGPMGSLHRYVAWSPDGRRLALTDVVGDAPGPIQLMDVSSGKTKDLAAINGFVFLKSVWLPDGRGLLVQYQDVSVGLNHNQIGFISYPGGQFHTITKDTNSYESLSLSADAKTLATVQLKRLFTLYVIPAAGTGASPPTPAIPQQQKGSLSFNWAGNDGFYLAEDRQLVRVSSNGSDKTTLLDNASITSVSVCPDGRTLLLSLIGQVGGSSTNIWRVNADGTNLKQLSNGKRDRISECSRDSKWAYYINANASRVERVPVDGGTPETLPGTPIPHALILDRYFDLSPDGKTAVFLIALGGTNPVHRIAMVPLDAGPRPQVRLLDPHPATWYPLRFTPDGKALVYPITQNRIENLWLQPLDGSPGRQITNFRTDLILGLQWSPDGKNIGLLSRRIDADVVLLRESSTKQ